MPRATVTEFTTEQGFGKIQLESGEVLNFDVVVCDTMDIDVGDECEVETKELAGRLVARRVVFGKGDEG